MANKITEHMVKKIIEDSHEKEMEISSTIAKAQHIVGAQLYGHGLPNDLVEHLIAQTKDFYSFQLDNEGRMRVLLNARYIS